MNPIEDRLRDAFRADADTISPHALRTASAAGTEADRRTRTPRPAGGLRRGGLVLPLAAAAAVAAIAAATLAAPAIWPWGTGRQPSPLASGFVGGSAPAASPPMFFVAILFGPSGNYPSARLKVINTKTGKIAGQLAPPAPHRYFEAVAPLGNNQTFVAEAAGTRCESWFYTFRLTALGRPTRLAPLAVPEVGGRPLSPQSLTASANGKEVAFATQKCSAVRRPKPYGQLGVLDLATSKVTTWNFKWPAAPGSLSLSADGRHLGLVSDPSSGKPVGSVVFNDDWIIRTGSPSGPLADRYRQVFGPPTWPIAALLSPTGKVTWALTPVQQGRRVRYRTLLRAYQTSSGKLIRSWDVLGRPTEILEPTIFTADASGRYALIMHTFGSQIQILDLATRHVSTVPGKVAVSPVPIEIAW